MSRTVLGLLQLHGDVGGLPTPVRGDTGQLSNFKSTLFRELYFCMINPILGRGDVAWLPGKVSWFWFVGWSVFLAPRWNGRLVSRRVPGSLGCRLVGG